MFGIRHGHDAVMQPSSVASRLAESSRLESSLSRQRDTPSGEGWARPAEGRNGFRLSRQNALQILESRVAVEWQLTGQALKRVPMFSPGRSPRLLHARGGQDDVGRLDVAMNDALVMRGGKRLSDLG